MYGEKDIQIYAILEHCQIDAFSIWVFFPSKRQLNRKVIVESRISIPHLSQHLFWSDDEIFVHLSKDHLKNYLDFFSSSVSDQKNKCRYTARVYIFVHLYTLVSSESEYNSKIGIF